MPFRVTETSIRERVLGELEIARQRLNQAHEQITSGKRINRPSDDPSGAAVVIRLRATQETLTQFRRSADAARDALVISDSVLDSYEQTLDRVRVLLSQGASDAASATSRQAVAAELEGIREQIRALANSSSQDQYLFGGTRQNAPPYDAAGLPAATPASPALIQIEPAGAPVISGVTAETVFADTTGTIFEALNTAITALRGTGDPAADSATLLSSLDRLTVLTDRARVARTQIGAGLQRVAEVTGRLERISLTLAETTQRFEEADLAEAALRFTNANSALEAIFRSTSALSRRSLIDFLG
jgi:flagellar hook-associated protein 3 FlgL